MSIAIERLDPAVRRAAGGLAFGTLFALIWAGSFVATKFALPLVQPLWLAAGRLVLAAGVLALVEGRPSLELMRSKTPGARWRIAGAAVLTQAVYLGGTFYVLETLSAAVVSVIGSTLPLVSIPVAALMLRERTSVIEIAATIAGVIGVVLVIAGKASSSLAAAGLPEAPVVVMLLAVVSLATGNALLKPIISRSEIMPLATVQMAVGGLVLVVVAALVEGAPAVQWQAGALAGMAYLVVVGSILGTWAWFATQERFSVITASGFFLLTPLFGIVLGHLLLGETLTQLQLAGAGMIGLGIAARSRFLPTRTDANR